MAGRVSESQFYMWRTLFAIAHADHVVTDEEVRFMSEALEDIPFSPEQYSVLKEDATTARDIEEMFKGITDIKDQAVFFKYARQLCHIDGDYGEEEQEVMLKLKRLHLQAGNFDEILSGSLDIEFEPDAPSWSSGRTPEPEKRLKGALSSFKKWFTG